jgi:ribosomal protein S27E
MAITITNSNIKSIGTLFSGPTKPGTETLVYVKCEACGHQQATPASGKVLFAGACPECGSKQVDFSIASVAPSWFKAIQ